MSRQSREGRREMKKMFIVLLVALFVFAISSESFAWQRGHRGYTGGHYSHSGYSSHSYRGGYYGGRHYGGGYYGRGYYDRYYWRDVGTTMAVIGGLAVVGAIIKAPYGNYDYGYQGCEKEIRYGHWEYGPYDNRRWVTTRIEIVPCY